MTADTAIYHPSWYDKSSVKELEVMYISPSVQNSLAEFNFVVVLSGAIFGCSDKDLFETEAVKREREIFNALDNGSVVCVTLMWNNDSLCFRIANRIGIYIQGTNVRADITAKRSEFSPFIKKFGAAGIRFYFPDRKRTFDFDDIICETRDGDVVGFVKKVGRGILILLACEVPLNQYQEPDFMTEFLDELLKSLRAYGSKVQYRIPNFIDSYRFPNEATLVSQVEELKKELNKTEKSLAKYQKLKETLWFRDNELVDSVISFSNEIGIQTKKDEIYEEDFWIVEHDKETVIVEVKGLDKNLTRPHISQLDEHRGAREKPDDFPALLIVNSFNKANSLKEKDEAISPNEIKKAVQTNVLILRTLDLCNAYYLMEKGTLDATTFLKIMKKEKGWLNVTASGYEIKQ